PPRSPPRSSLFPYTTLFRSTALLLGYPSSGLYSSTYPPSAISPPAIQSPYTHWPSHCSPHCTDPAAPKSGSYHISLQPSQTSYTVHPTVPHNSDHPHPVPAQIKDNLLFPVS